MRSFVITLIGIVFSFSVAFAQVATPTTQSGATLATTQEITASDLSVPDPSYWQISKRKIMRFFTFSQIKKARISLELANLALLQAREAAKAGDQTRVTTLIDSYNEQISASSASLDQITSQFMNISNPDVQNILSQIENTRLLEVSLLDSLNLKATGKLNDKITQVRSEALKDLTEILTKENLSPDELTKKINEISKKLEDKELKANKKFIRKMDVLNDLSKKSDDQELDDVIIEIEKDELDDVSKEPEDVLDEVTDEASKRNDLVTLQELLTRVPDVAKPAIQAKIDREVAKLSVKMKDNPNALEQAIKKDEKNIEAKKQLLEKIKTENEKADESVKKEIEKKSEELKKAQEKETENQSEDASDNEIR